MKQGKLYKNHPQIETLKNHQLTNVLGEGLAMIFHQKPEFPITYLSQFIFNYLKTKNETSNLDAIRDKKQKIIDQQKKQQEQTTRRRSEDEKEKYKVNHRTIEFKNQISKQQDYEKFLNKFCTWLQQSYNLAGVYIGELKFPKKQVLITDMNENAHLDVDQPRIIEYIASSENQQPIILNKTLNADSLTGSLFQKKEENIEETDESKPQQNYIYVPNIIKDERMTFLRFPKLGSYIAIPMFCKSYNNQNSFEIGLQQTLKQMKAKQQIQKQLEKKQIQFKEAYDQRVRNDADEKELQQMERKFEQQKAALSAQQIDIPYQQVQFVVCADTMGLQSEIPENNRKQLVQYVQLLKKGWESISLQRIKQDIDNQIKYIQMFQGNTQQAVQKVIEADQKELDDMQEFQKYKSNQKEYQFQIQSAKLQKLKEVLTDEKYQAYFTSLLSMNVIRYRPIIQMLLYFLGYKKNQINIQETNMLDWGKVKTKFLNQHTIDRLVQYTHRGAKSAPIEPYAKWSQILSVLQKFDLPTVYSYNLFYGKILKYLMMTAKLRKIDSELRQQKLKALRIARTQKIAQNQKLSEQKERVREEQKAAHEGNEQNPFDQEAWEIQYNQDHPLLEIQPQYQDEVDRDLIQEQENQAQ